ncbi:LysR substrate-binding domain-containing protein [Glaesserella sp.]|uniref:LysR family transcriptional regulator n=1 Tax=Glaesserella sp. TaxID=2094731 RepID=UPI00359F9A05
MKLLDDMALFVEVVKAQSFTRASAFLDIPKSTLSVRISKLEKLLGLRLLNRTTRKIDLTEAGARYYERAVRIVDEAKLIHQQLNDVYQEPTGLLKVTLPADLANLFVAPVLREFCDKYPKIELDLDIAWRSTDLYHHSFDLAIDLDKPASSDLSVCPLANIQGGIYASDDYLQQFGSPKNINELKKHRCLPCRQHEWHLINQEQEKIIPVHGHLGSNSLTVTQRLASEGLGLALLPDLAAKLTGKEMLKRILPEWQSKAISVYAITPTKLLPAKIQVFIAFLKEKLEQLANKR